ncbi:MAG TPA: hypothetical protein VG326_18670 [Tepidisphaeraceae bacterium]|jgi:type II secretory pathway pseudopilin PulG|nr:hypothetical protein [Tepidisphaeraceae bacterium]
MFTSDTLDSLIALVIVILLLSLIVQSAQGIVKKLLQIKSKQIEDSLIDLFENVLDSKDRLPNKGFLFLAASPTLRALFRSKYTPQKHPDPKVLELYRDVTTSLKSMGRITQFGGQAFESISKADLLKVIAKTGVEKLAPGFAGNLTAAVQQIIDLEAIVHSIATASLSGPAIAKLAAFQTALGPLVKDARAFMLGARLDPKDLVGDVKSLREIKLDDAVVALADLQNQIKVDRAAAPAGSAEAAALDAVRASLDNVAASVDKSRQLFDASLAVLRARLKRVETWFDTVMQGFSERYSRSMKTCTIWISVLVVVILNADIFPVWQAAFQNKASRDAILAYRQEALHIYGNQLLPNASDAAIKKGQDEITGIAKSYTGLGFGWQSFVDAADEIEKPPAPREASIGTIVSIYRAHMDWLRKSIVGWIAMVVSLSFGAPFWHDMLESLFGLKTALRAKGQIKDVEEESGAGNPQNT